VKIFRGTGNLLAGTGNFICKLANSVRRSFGVRD
jgi:hypothetical protein